MDEHYREAITAMEETAALQHILAIGEAGLDKLRGPALNLQIAAYKAQALMADKFGKPLIIHCVRCYNEVIESHKKLDPSAKWIIHNFTGSRELAESLIRRGISLSFGLSLMKNHAKTIEALAAVPLECIFFETDDDPGLRIETVYAKAAAVRNMDVESLRKAVRDNFEKYFKLTID